MSKTNTLRPTLILLASLSVIALSACASQNGTSRYGGEAIVDCVPASMPCAPAPVYRPIPMSGRMQAPPPVYVPAPVTTAPPQAAPLPSVPLPSAPASPVYEPYIPEAAPVPYTPEPYVPEPYTPPLPPIRNNRPVVDDPAKLPCPEGSIPGYGGADCIQITVPRK